MNVLQGCHPIHTASSKNTSPLEEFQTMREQMLRGYRPLPPMIPIGTSMGSMMRMMSGEMQVLLPLVSTQCAAPCAGVIFLGQTQGPISHGTPWLRMTHEVLLLVIIMHDDRTQPWKCCDQPEHYGLPSMIYLPFLLPLIISLPTSPILPNLLI